MLKFRLQYQFGAHNQSGHGENPLAGSRRLGDCLL